MYYLYKRACRSRHRAGVFLKREKSGAEILPFFAFLCCTKPRLKMHTQAACWDVHVHFICTCRVANTWTPQKLYESRQGIFFPAYFNTSFIKEVYNVGVWKFITNKSNYIAAYMFICCPCSVCYPAFRADTSTSKASFKILKGSPKVTCSLPLGYTIA